MYFGAASSPLHSVIFICFLCMIHARVRPQQLVQKPEVLSQVFSQSGHGPPAYYMEPCLPIGHNFGDKSLLATIGYPL